MKTMHRRLIVSILPLFAPLTILADSGPTPQEVSESVAKAQRVKADSWRATQIIGTNVKNAADESIGDVEDLVIDFKTGEVLAVVVSSGGFLGIADTLSQLPVAALRYDVDAKAFTTNLTKEQLQQAPNFKNSMWPDYNDPNATTKLRGYRDSIDGNDTAADNSARNKQEMRTGATNPTDQGSGANDLETTRKIRSGIVDADLSFNTKNIKIITDNGRVTLKGVVKDKDEHEKVIKIARAHADTSRITDDLMVDEK